MPDSCTTAILFLTALCAVGWIPATAGGIGLGSPADRADRLITIHGQREEEAVVEYSLDAGKAWHPATVYVGTTIDEWRPCEVALWNRAALEGRIPAGDQPCVWNHYFDLPRRLDAVLLRFKSAQKGNVLLQKTLDLSSVGNVFVIDRDNVSDLAGGMLPAPWTFQRGTKAPGSESFGIRLTKSEVVSGRHPVFRIKEASAVPLVLAPNLTGWYRIYVGMESYGSLQLHLSGEGIKYPVPEYLSGVTPRSRLMQEFHVKSMDMTGQQVCLECGGARYWRDASVRFIRFVPMTADEVAHWREVREMAQSKGRPFAGYVEQCTPCHYEPRTLTLRAHTRNEMRLSKVRGCTDVYVHVIRLGSKAWYHSDVVERYLPEDDQGPDAPAAKWTAWMHQGDPLAVAIEEARAVGLKVFPDMGMNVSYEGALREQTITRHPEYLCGGSGIFLDYRKPQVRAYAVAIATELMTKYDVDGINLDFARFADNKAFDERSLVDVVDRIDEARKAAERKWGHRILIATRIPSYRYHQRNSPRYSGDYTEFTNALAIWAREGQVDRAVACSMGNADYVSGLSVERYRSALKGTKTRLWGDLYGGGAFWATPRSVWIEAARKWVSEGLDGGFFFYTTDRPTEFEQINWQLRLIDFPERRIDPSDR